MTARCQFAPEFSEAEKPTLQLKSCVYRDDVMVAGHDAAVTLPARMRAVHYNLLMCFFVQINHSLPKH